MSETAVFFTGAIAMGFVVAAIFFARFWRRTGDRLFAVFAVAFGLMALNQALVGLLDVPREEQSPIFVLRLLAFLLIIAAVLWKNMGGRRS